MIHYVKAVPGCVDRMRSFGICWKVVRTTNTIEISEKVHLLLISRPPRKPVQPHSVTLSPK